MTTLTWRGNIVDDNYLFTSHDNSWYEKSGWDDEDAMDYRLELDDIKEQIMSLVIKEKKALKISKDIKGSDLASIATTYKTDVVTEKKVRFSDSSIEGIGYEPELIGGIFACLLRFLYRLINSFATGISSSGSSVKETRIVSPIPSSNNEPIPIEDLTLPGIPSPASVTPKCNG